MSVARSTLRYAPQMPVRDAPVLAPLISVRRAPRYLRSDYGPEFVLRAPLRWGNAESVGDGTDRPGHAVAERRERELQRPLVKSGFVATIGLRSKRPQQFELLVCAMAGVASSTSAPIPACNSASAVAGSSANWNSARSFLLIMPCRTRASKLMISFQ